MIPSDCALTICNRYGGTEEWHHQSWVIDQMVRALTGDGYTMWVRFGRLAPTNAAARSPREAALQIAAQHGCIEYSPYQRWAIDQMVRALAGDSYEQWVAAYRGPDPGGSPDDTWEWSEGTPPPDLTTPRTAPWYVGITP